MKNWSQADKIFLKVSFYLRIWRCWFRLVGSLMRVTDWGIEGSPDLFISTQMPRFETERDAMMIITTYLMWVGKRDIRYVKICSLGRLRVYFAAAAPLFLPSAPPSKLFRLAAGKRSNIYRWLPKLFLSADHCCCCYTYMLLFVAQIVFLFTENVSFAKGNKL